MCIFKKYKNLLGKPGTGVHKYKIFDVIIVDNLINLILSILMKYLTSIPFELSIIIVYLLGLLFHYLFGVKTESMKYLGLKCL